MQCCANVIVGGPREPIRSSSETDHIYFKTVLKYLRCANVGPSCARIVPAVASRAISERGGDFASRNYARRPRATIVRITGTKNRDRAGANPADAKVRGDAKSAETQQTAPEAPATTPAANQTHLPQIVVTAPKSKPRSKPKPSQEALQPTARNAPTPAQAALDAKMQGFDQARDNLLPKIGASTYTINREAIETMPQGDNAPIDKVILQMPGVSYDSAASNPNFHVRGEYANVQIRINGVVLPEGVSALGPVLDTNFIGSMSLLTGTLPAQYGLRTAGVLDITSRSFAVPGGEVSLYGGSRQTFTPSFDYGGSVGNTEYFVTARGNWNALGLENPTSSPDAIHDHTEQGKFFGYASTLLDESTRFSVISAASYSAFQIPNNPNQMPLGDFGPANFNSALLNENEYDTYIANIATLAKEGHRRRRAIRALFALRQDQLRSRYLRRPGVQRRGIERDARKPAQRHSVRYVLHRQRPAHAAGRLRGQRRANQRQQRLDGPARRSGHRHHFADAVRDHRPEFEARLEHRHLHSRRMEDSQSAYPEHGPAFRPIVSVRRCQPAQPARRLGLQAVRRHHDSRRLRALFHAALSGAGGAIQHRTVHQHHQSAGGAAGRSGEARTLELL